MKYLKLIEFHYNPCFSQGNILFVPGESPKRENWEPQLGRNFLMEMSFKSNVSLQTTGDDE